VLPARDAVAQVLVVAGLARALEGLERHAELPDVVFVALELTLEIGVVTRVRVFLAIPLHCREDLVLGQARVGRQQREDEAEEPLLYGDAGGGAGWWHECDPNIGGSMTPGQCRWLRC